eukprot:TRINITY_DN15247_c0_g1_i1.p1 TRINITY_DN15247_c0_g1~~TRINITY_DN15247_c0_g1_i1.p1  ORF type:complete len:594 (-),score=90.05 TRINITY_DN15247_c0_g1_i1:29-1810(-)
MADDPNSSARHVSLSMAEPTFEELAGQLRELSPRQQRATCGLLGTAIGDAVGLPFELHAHCKNRSLIDKFHAQHSMSETYCAFVLELLADRMKPSAGTPFGRTFSDDTVCTDLKMQAVAKVAWTCPRAEAYEESVLFEDLMQEYLCWAYNADGCLFQGFGGFTKDLLRPSRDNRLGQLGITLWKPNSDFAPTAEYLQFAAEHFQGSYPGGFPSWGNGAVMSLTPAYLFEYHHRAGSAARVLSASHQEASAMLAAELLVELLHSIHENTTSSCKDISSAVLRSACWQRHVGPLKSNERQYFHPIDAFEEFLSKGDCEADTANSFLISLITNSMLTPNENEVITGPKPFGNFGEVLRIASNFDDQLTRKGQRLTVAGRPDECVRFSQRGLNSVIIAIWCAQSSNSCWEWLQRVLYVGGDSDTVGAVAGQIACPLLDLDDVALSFRRFVALEEPSSTDANPANNAATRRFWKRCMLFAKGCWAELLQTPRLVDPAYAGITTEDGMRLANQSRISCRFGSKCYDTKRGHRSQYAHPGDDDWARMCCRFAERCHDFNPEHRREFTHPGESDWNDMVLLSNGTGSFLSSSRGKGGGRFR